MDECKPLVWGVLSAFLCLMPCSAVSTDGTHLQRALQYVEDQARLLYFCYFPSGSL